MRNGFSLVELLVTMVILAIAASMAMVLSGASGHRSLRQQMYKLQGEIELASEEAWARNQTLGLNFKPSAQGLWQYRWLVLHSANKWQPLSNAIESLSDGEITLPIELQFYDGFYKSDTKSASGEGGLKPQLAFFNNGETSEIRMIAQLNELKLELTISSLGLSQLSDSLRPMDDEQYAQ